MRAPIAIGIGCRRDCPAEAIVALVGRTRSLAGADRPARLFTIADKRGEVGLARAAALLNLPLTFLSREALRAVGAATSTPSAAAEARFGVPSVSEAAALAGAGPGARLVVLRIATGQATCAAAVAGEDAE